MSIQFGHNYTFSANIIGRCPSSGAYLVENVENIKPIFNVNDFVIVEKIVGVIIENGGGSSCCVESIVGKKRNLYYNSALRFATQEEVDKAREECKVVEEKKKEDERLALIAENRAQLRYLLDKMSTDEKIENVNVIMQSIVPPSATMQMQAVEKEKAQK